MKKTLIALVAVALLAGCATTGANYAPLVDLRPGQTPQQMHADLAECQQHAKQRMDAAQGAMAGAIFGALLGAALGAAGGGNSRFNTHMAGVGAVSGGAAAAGSAEVHQRTVISRCMAGRGYMVLD